MRDSYFQFYPMSSGMREYLRTYGMHFNKLLCEDAVSMMRDRNNEKIAFPDKEAVLNVLKNYDVKLKNDVLWDVVYVYCMCKADFWGSSIEDELHLARYVKDYLDDPDGYDEIAFSRWYADCCKTGVFVDWDSYL